jgi:hypothetical protein
MKTNKPTRTCPTKRAAKILPDFSGWTASPSPRDGAGIPFGDDGTNRWAAKSVKNPCHTTQQKEQWDNEKKYFDIRYYFDGFISNK